MKDEQNKQQICNYFKSGETKLKQLGIEVEHFVCDDDYNTPIYEEIKEFILKAKQKTGGELWCEDGHILGLYCKEYMVSLEPSCQLEISILPQTQIAQIKRIYTEFFDLWSEIVGEKNYKLINKGIHPLVENATKTPDDFELIPKKRYELMNDHFEKSGKFGKYMMRTSCALQVSVDYEDMHDAMNKLRLLQIMSPLLALIAQNQSKGNVAPFWQKHILRTQIWRDTDNVRCGFFPGSTEKNYTYEQYANHVYTHPLICYTHAGKTQALNNLSAQQYFKQTGQFDATHTLSMFFPDIRLKKYLEIRVADSLPMEKMLGYTALIKGLIYGKNSLIALNKLFENVTTEQQIYAGEKEIAKDGYSANIYGQNAADLVIKLFDIAHEGLEDIDTAYLKYIMPLPAIQKEYCNLLNNNFNEHINSAKQSKQYIQNSTAKYHNRVVRAMYVPKIFTKNEVDTFKNLINELYTIFDKVIENYICDENYRLLFNFDKRLESLILRPKTYECNIPIARIDVFYNEQTGRFNFCEFNTDGTSAMNEDRELNSALKITYAYKEFAKKYNINTFELFDTWIDEFLSIYDDYAKKQGKTGTPNVAIVDFLDIGTTNEFEIFKQRFTKRGINAELCDIKDLQYENGKCTTKTGMQVNAIYRRAVTTDIMKHYDELQQFFKAVTSGNVCLVGDFRTQIVHNKILYKILHDEQTHKFLTNSQIRFIKNHVPYTTSLTSKILQNNKNFARAVYENKNNWIIKPEDSYGSYGVHAGVECDEKQWKKFVDECTDKGYIIQMFYNPYQMKNIDLTHENEDDIKWHSTSNLTGLFVYAGKMCGTYSRISYDEMISTQYNEMSLPTIVVSNK